jgi:hypothetical protein
MPEWPTRRPSRLVWIRPWPLGAGALTSPSPWGKVRDVIEIESFLNAYRPKFICLPCLSAVTSRDQEDVRGAVNALLAERRAETDVAECLNCNAMAFVVRRLVR